MTTAQEAERLLLGERQCRACHDWAELNADGLCPSCVGNYFRCEKCDRLYDDALSVAYDGSCCQKCDSIRWEQSYNGTDYKYLIEGWRSSEEGLVDEGR
jgi:phage FluMu protein Com